MGLSFGHIIIVLLIVLVLFGAGKLPAQMGGKENIGFRATATIKRSDFGVLAGIPLSSWSRTGMPRFASMAA